MVGKCRHSRGLGRLHTASSHAKRNEALADYTTTMVDTDFSVYLIKIDDPLNFRVLNVISVDDSAKTLKV